MENSSNVRAKNNELLFSVATNENIFIAFGIALVAVILAFQAIIIYSHTMFSEYDSLYLFLPISKSILLGNGLNHDFYLGSDINMRFPPFVQAVNAWLLHSFEYSSIRMFPFYYIFFTAVLVYGFARNVLSKGSYNRNESFFALIASSVFLITPALLVTSSRFSLQQDIPFIFFLTASFYFLSEIIRYKRPDMMNLLILNCSLALLILTREIGILISIAIFFIVPAIRYTESNLKLRLLFTVLSLLPFYFYYLFFYSAYPINTGLMIVILSNLAIFYLVSKIRNQNNFPSLLNRGINLKYISPLLVPAIFIVTNIIAFNGVYPDITFSDKFYEKINMQLEIFADQKVSGVELKETIEGLLRIDILFLATAAGGIFAILKLIGLGKIVYSLKSNFEYTLIIILLIFLLISWASLLQSGFEEANIRHIAYFVPLLSVLLVVGIHRDSEPGTYWKIFCYFIIVFATFYFLSFNLHTSENNGKFEGFAIDPFRNPIVTTTDLVIGIMLSLPLLIIGLKKLRLLRSHHNIRLMVPKFPFAITVISLTVLLALQIYVLTSSEIPINIPPKQDLSLSPGWETNVFEVINYLNTSERGNVLGVRAPAIPFFSNRTSFDLYYPQSFAYSISDLILGENTTAFKQGLNDLGIRYIVIPNERSNLFYIVENLMNKSRFIQNINEDDDFEKVVFKNFNIYKYSPGSGTIIDLIHENHIWKSFGNTKVAQKLNNLTIHVDTAEKGKEYNRAYLETILKVENTPLLLSLSYNISTIIGNVTYLVELRDSNDNILFESPIDNLSGNLTKQTFLLPEDIKAGEMYEFRIYVITQGPGSHELIVSKLSLLNA